MFDHLLPDNISLRILSEWIKIKPMTLPSNYDNDNNGLRTISNTPFTRSKNYLDRDLDSNLDSDLDSDPEDVPIYTRHSLFNTTKRIALLFIAQSLLHLNLSNIWIILLRVHSFVCVSVS